MQISTIKWIKTIICSLKIGFRYKDSLINDFNFLISLFSFWILFYLNFEFINDSGHKIATKSLYICIIKSKIKNIDMKGKVAIITASSTGIGKAIAIRLAQ